MRHVKNPPRDDYVSNSMLPDVQFPEQVLCDLATMGTSRHFNVRLFDQRYLWCITTRPSITDGRTQ